MQIARVAGEGATAIGAGRDLGPVQIEGRGAAAVVGHRRLLPAADAEEVVGGIEHHLVVEIEGEIVASVTPTEVVGGLIAPDAFFDDPVIGAGVFTGVDPEREGHLTGQIQGVAVGHLDRIAAAAELLTGADGPVLATGGHLVAAVVTVGRRIPVQAGNAGAGGLFGQVPDPRIVAVPGGGRGLCCRCVRVAVVHPDMIAVRAPVDLRYPYPDQ